MEDLETLLLGHAPSLTKDDVEALSGIPDAVSLEIWTAMGFAQVPDGEVAFTTADVAALKTAASLLELGVIDADTLLVMARAMGQELARLAAGFVDVIGALSEGMTVEEALGAVAASADDVLPKLDELVLFVWRRQFAAAVQRSVATVREDGMPVQTIGFLDLVNFTRSTRDWDAAQLEKTLERFERNTSSRVAAVGGRVVKTLGDGVLFTVSSAHDAVAVALDTVDAHEADPDLPSVCGGLARGPVLLRLGDVFGEPVNIASRLADEARPGSVLASRSVVESLGEEFEARELHKRSVRGYRSLTPWLVRRPPER